MSNEIEEQSLPLTMANSPRDPDSEERGSNDESEAPDGPGRLKRLLLACWCCRRRTPATGNDSPAGPGRVKRFFLACCCCRRAPATTPTVAGEDGVVVERGWDPFYADANQIIQWCITTVILFVPPKLVAMFYFLLMKNNGDFEAAFLDLVKEASILPSLVLPGIFLYVAFHLCSKIFMNRKMKLIFEVASIIFGFGCAIATLYFVGSTSKWWTTFAIIVFMVGLWIAGVIDLLCT